MTFPANPVATGSPGTAAHKRPRVGGHMNSITRVMLMTGWSGMLGGVVSGAVLGLFFHKENWMGGSASFRRRLARLGHISFFGLGFLNLLLAFTNQLVALPHRAAS